MTLLVAERTSSPIFKNLNLRVPHQRNAWQSLCEKIKENEKERVSEDRVQEASGLRIQPQEVAVKFMKRPDER